MILKNYKNYFFPLVLFFIYSVLVMVNIHWTSLSLFIFGSIWEFARTHEDLKARSTERKYQFSFIRLFYKYNSLFDRWRFSVLLAPSLFLIPFALFLNLDLFFLNIIAGTLVTFTLRLIFKRYL